MKSCYFVPRMDTKICDPRVCMSLYVCLSVRSCISKTASKLHEIKIKVDVGPRHCTTVGRPSLACVTCRPLRNAELLFVSLMT